MPDSNDVDDRSTPRIVPVYANGCDTPHLEWVDGPDQPRDWCRFANETYLPRPWEVDVESAASVDEWRRSAWTYMRELEQLRSEWDAYASAVEVARRSVEICAVTDAEVTRLFERLEAEITENRQLLAAFAAMTADEIDDVESTCERFRDDP